MSEASTVQSNNSPGINQIGEAPPQIPANHTQVMVNPPATPLVMPGAGAASKQPNQPVLTETAAAPAEQTTPSAPDAAGNSADTVELDRFKAVQQIARRNEDDAKKWRTMSEALSAASGTEDGKALDPMSEIAKLRTEITRERIARETGIPPQLLNGSDEDSMRGMATIAQALIDESAKAAIAAAVPSAPQVPVTPPPATFPATSVTSDGKVLGPTQLTRDQLRGMTSAQIKAAVEDGRCDQIMGKTPAM